MSLNKTKTIFLCLTAALSGFTPASQAALAKFEYFGNSYSSIIDNPIPTGSYNPLQQMRGVFYVDDTIADTPLGSVNQLSDNNAISAGLFGLELFDGRNTMDGLTKILKAGSRVSFLNGQVEDWRLTVTTITPIEALLEGEQWVELITSKADGDGARIVECIENCSRDRTFNEVNGFDRASVSSASASARTFAAIAAAEATGQWVRDPNRYELAEDGSIVAVVPVPAAAWLFGSGLLGLVGVARRKKA